MTHTRMQVYYQHYAMYAWCTPCTTLLKLRMLYIVVYCDDDDNINSININDNIIHSTIAVWTN